MHTLALNHQAGFSYSSHVTEIHGSIVSWLQTGLEDMVLFMIEVPIVSTLDWGNTLFTSDRSLSKNCDHVMREIVGKREISAQGAQ